MPTDHNMLSLLVNLIIPHTGRLKLNVQIPSNPESTSQARKTSSGAAFREVFEPCSAQITQVRTWYRPACHRIQTCSQTHTLSLHLEWRKFCQIIPPSHWALTKIESLASGYSL